MADVVVVDDAPEGADAYGGYVDGAWQTYLGLIARFPGVPVLSITATGVHADECDCESGDLAPQQAATWAATELAVGNRWPGIYAAVSAMEEVLYWLGTLRVLRSQVMLDAAHWGKGNHVCGEATCGDMPGYADMTQWCDWGTWDQSALEPKVLAALRAGWKLPPVPPIRPHPAPKEDTEMYIARDTSNGDCSTTDGISRVYVSSPTVTLANLTKAGYKTVPYTHADYLNLVQVDGTPGPAVKGA
jgi:hypothetical protein